jgi:hypothetical protein
MRHRNPDGGRFRHENRAIAFTLLEVWVLTSPLSFAQKPDCSDSVPKYDMSREAKFKGVVEEVKDRICPISGGMGLHLMVKIGAKIYEVQVAPVKFVKIYQAAFQKGDTVEMIGARIKFQGVDAILPREIKDGDYDLVFRDEKGKPIW